MKKTLLPIGVLILVVSLLLAVVGPISAAGECTLEIHKKNSNGEALAGATFVISPNPKIESIPRSGELTIVDNGLNDENPSVGILLITNLQCDGYTEYTITETVAPPGYTPALPQTGFIYDEGRKGPLVLTFINEPIVGGEAQHANIVSTAIPWIGLALIGIAGIFIVLKRRLLQS